LRHGKQDEEKRNVKVKFCFLFVQASQAVKRIFPLFDRVLVERFAAQTTTKGGLHLPEKSLGKVLNATVVAVGKGIKQRVSQLYSIDCIFFVCLGWNIFSSECTSW